jgi:hypothetical protein
MFIIKVERNSTDQQVLLIMISHLDSKKRISVVPPFIIVMDLHRNYYGPLRRDDESSAFIEIIEQQQALYEHSQMLDAEASLAYPWTTGSVDDLIESLDFIPVKTRNKRPPSQHSRQKKSNNDNNAITNKARTDLCCLCALTSSCTRNKNCPCVQKGRPCSPMAHNKCRNTICNHNVNIDYKSETDYEGD